MIPMSAPEFRCQVSLQSLHTLALPVSAAWLVELTDDAQLPAIMAEARRRQLPWLVLGEGSNVLFRKDFEGLVIRMCNKGIQVTEQGERISLKVSAGENWHQLVLWCLAQGYYGLENLALIPGTVGAAPIQNIGAYGVELAEHVLAVHGWDTELANWQCLSAEACGFGYRDSVFKHRLQGRFIITAVELSLSRKPAPNLSYGALKQAFHDSAPAVPTPGDVADTVIAIRRSKLPDPATLPNAGSFFKNPVLSHSDGLRFLQRWPMAPHYPLDNGDVKIAAGWLIEQVGWKGRLINGAGMHVDQALVLVNPGRVNPEQLLLVARQVALDVQAKFGLELQVEPALI